MVSGHALRLFSFVFISKLIGLLFLGVFGLFYFFVLAFWSPYFPLNHRLTILVLVLPKFPQIVHSLPLKIGLIPTQPGLKILHNIASIGQIFLRFPGGVPDIPIQPFDQIVISI